MLKPPHVSLQECSKHELGLAVVDHLVQLWKHELIENILQSNLDPKTKLNRMLEWVIEYHRKTEGKRGCPFGNLALEMSEHDEAFRAKINELFKTWVDHLTPVLKELMHQEKFEQELCPEKWAQALVSTIEGGILLMKNHLDLQVLQNVIDVIRIQLRLVNPRDK
ncbi:LmrA/YxaF family transcription factor [Calditerricola satsumensis]|uniref:Transcriptional regulator LmrA/YxaF-like C-terminal domain-containing protein n=1 Tax=Calditerricola satsumensis TaxID=373054 RepID=A0A8J3FD69_9BACI|nr:TetR family transcriptional regulator C-terminal domain-containing protein [Calditerricola satsumensis]GGK08454.1 hypothetical protein GCM10007043_23180 [Calditerricola satsumensis]